MGGIWMYLLSAVAVLVTPGVYRVEAIEVTTSKEVTAVNGTSVQLKCTFKSTEPVSEEKVSVSWNFRASGQKQEESIMFYQLKAYIPTKFIGHVTWSGNIPKNDASITLHDVQFRFNGTYSCQVRNPPDVHGFAGEVNLQVVQSVKLSEIGILAAAVGGAILVVLVILAIFIGMRYCRKKNEDTGVEWQKTEGKQSSVW